MADDYLYRAGALFVGMSGIKAVYAGEGNTTLGVKALPETLETPCIVIWEADVAIIPASWERRTIELEARLYVARTGRSPGEAYEAGRSATFRNEMEQRVRGAAGVLGHLSAIVPSGWRAVGETEWPPTSGNWYLVRALVIQGKFNQAVTYSPPT